MKSIVLPVGETLMTSEKCTEFKGKKGLSCSRKRHHGSDDEWTYNGGYSGYVGSRYWGDDGANDHCDYRQEDRSYRSDRRDDKQEGKRGKPSDSQRGEYRGLRRQNIPRRQDQDSEEGAAKKKAETEANEAELWKKKEDPVMTRTGGAYIPPAKLRMMQSQITDKSSVAFQRLTWEALKKSIHGLINKVNTSNIGNVVFSLIKENIIRGRGLFARSIIQAQAASPTFTHIYAALTAVINSKFPDIGELVLTRLILRFRRSFCRNDISVCISSTRFIAHLVNQQVACEVLALEILTLLLENATGHSVEVAVGFLKECGQKLGQVSPRGLTAVFDRLRHILHEVDLDKRVKYMIEVMFQVRKDGFKDYPAVMEELDLVEEKDQITHLVSTAEENLNGEDILNVFNPDPDYEAKEERYSAIKKEILGVKCGQSGESAVESDDEFEGESDSDEEEVHKGAIADETETNSTAFRRAIYLTIQSSLDHNECAHKVMKMRMKPGQKTELCHMILDCCAQEKMYNISFGLLAERFCRINKSYIASFEQIFRNSYDTIHRLDNNQLRNVASMFAHLLFTDAISWQVLEHLRLTEEGTTSSSRIFLKILFQKLAENMGLGKLNQRLKDPTLESAFEGIFPRDHPCNTRFAINFFTSVGLGVLTDELRVHLRTHPKPPPVGVPRPVSALSAAAAQLLIEQSSDSGSSSSS